MIDTNDSEFLSRIEDKELLSKVCDAKKAWENGQGFTKWLGLSGMFITLAMAVNGMADFVLFSRSISFYFWGLSALCISGINIRKEKENGGKE